MQEGQAEAAKSPIQLGYTVMKSLWAKVCVMSCLSDWLQGRMEALLIEAPKLLPASLLRFRCGSQAKCLIHSFRRSMRIHLFISLSPSHSKRLCMP